MVDRAGDKPIFTDLQDLERLRGAARQDDPEALREVAEQFESLFTHMMLQTMREASFGDDLTGGGQTDFYRDMFDQQIAVEMGSGGGQGLGLAEMIVRELGGEDADVPPPQSADGAAATNAASSNAAPASDQEGEEEESQSDGVARDTDKDELAQKLEEAGENGDPEGFLEGIWPLARKAAGELGVAPHLIAAQAALETGWGRGMIRDADGDNSFNLFGIKAGGEWKGDQVRVPTLEYESGMAVRRNEPFRAYQSPEESVDDYVRLLKESPRYREALEQGGDANAFARALQEGGYATDPEYAEKIQRVADSEPIRRVAGEEESGGGELKDLRNRPYE